MGNGTCICEPRCISQTQSRKAYTAAPGGQQHAFRQQLADQRNGKQRSARRTAISLRRSAARASIMFATLAHAISKTRPAITIRNCLKNGTSLFA